MDALRVSLETALDQELDTTSDLKHPLDLTGLDIPQPTRAVC